MLKIERKEMRLLMSLRGFDEGQKYTRHHDTHP